jgi:hypothetical protein
MYTYFFLEYITAVDLPQVPLSDSATVTIMGWGQESDRKYICPVKDPQQRNL